MEIDCATCPGRGHACDGCVMTLLMPRMGAVSGNDGRSSRYRLHVEDPFSSPSKTLHWAVANFAAAGMLADANDRLGDESELQHHQRVWGESGPQLRAV